VSKLRAVLCYVVGLVTILLGLYVILHYPTTTLPPNGLLGWVIIVLGGIIIYDGYVVYRRNKHGK
jgi:uncharacterized membrane protein HdeD (DUF308 family)